MTRDTEDVVALVEGARRAAAIGRSSCNITAQKFGNHLNALANTIQFLSDRIDVLSARAQRVVDRNVGLVPGYRSAGLADAIDELSAALHQEGIRP